MPHCQGCLKEGGRTNCELRACASNEKIDDCSECDEPKVCKNKEILKHMRTGALAAGLFVKTKKTDPQRLVRKWVSELKTKWPSYILFPQDRKASTIRPEARRNAKIRQPAE